MIKRMLTIVLVVAAIFAQAQNISGKVRLPDGRPAQDVMIFLEGTGIGVVTDKTGSFFIDKIEKGEYRVVALLPEYRTAYKDIIVSGKPISLSFMLEENLEELEEVTVSEKREEVLGINWLQSVDGTAIYEAKKTELIQIDQIIANKGANNSRQIYSRVPGLNIWENDGAGLQLGIGGRGLNPNRTSNFNVRQNGYDISADALGYPESYYTPPVQALERIEIVRGAAGLQYGTQFGGMLNFDFKEGPEDKNIELDVAQTLGSFGLFNSFNSIGGTVGKVNYYGFYQYKRSDGWRPNSHLEQHTAFASAIYNFRPFLSVKLEHTYMSYLAQQPGGLTDKQFSQDARQSNRNRNWFNVGWNLSAMEWNYRLSPSIKLNNRTFHLSAHRFAVGNLTRIDRLDIEDTNRNLLKDEYNNWGNEFRAIFHYSLLGQKSVLLLGNRIYFGETDQVQGMGSSAADADFTFTETEGQQKDSEYFFPSSNVAFFAENIFNLSDKISVTPGVRYEHIHTASDGYYLKQTRDLSGNIISEEKLIEDRASGRSLLLLGMGFSYKHSEHIELYSNFSQNYRAINFNDIRVINESLVVDENIRDELGYNVDLGIRGSEKGNYRYDVSLFYLSYQGRIGPIQKSGDGRRTFTFRSNVGDANIFGVETYFEGSLMKLFHVSKEQVDLTGFVNLALIRSEYLRSEINGVAGNEVELVPPMNLKTGVTFTHGNLGIAYLYSWVAEHYSDASNADDSPTAVEGVISSYQVMDLSATYKVKNWTLETGINNILNEHYFTRRASGYPGPGIIPSDGRSFYLTVGARF